MRRLHRIWETILWGDTTWAEIASGLALILLRGAVLQWGPAIAIPSDVSDLLRQVGITEGRWGTYLMGCGVLQVWVAGQSSPWRLGVTIAILAGFVTMAAAFLVTEPGHVNASLICMSAFYTFLLGRVFRDRDAEAGVRCG